VTGRSILVLVLGLAVLAGVLWVFWPKQMLSRDDILRAYATPLDPPEEPLRAFFLGHSLVGRDMPAMLAQLAGPGHGYESQLGWGTSLREHYEPDLPINGFDVENDHPRYRDAKEALGSGDYDAVVLTEMVEIRDAIKYHDSGTYFAKWVALAREGNPEVRVYLYESWPRLDDPEGWLERLDLDLERYWLGQVAAPALKAGPDRPVFVIPAGQVMAELVRRMEAGGLGTREDLFQRRQDGTLDMIHVNDLGAYLVALTHFAVLYHRSPAGLSHELNRADGTPADAPAPQLARLMQEVVWQVVTAMPETGVGG